MGKTEHEPEHTELEAQSEGASRHESEMAGEGLNLTPRAKPRAGYVACTAVACHISESVTLGHIRSHSCRDVLVYCRDVVCNHNVTMNADHLPTTR